MYQLRYFGGTFVEQKLICYRKTIILYLNAAPHTSTVHSINHMYGSVLLYYIYIIGV